LAPHVLLNRVRESGDWESWLEFFADAVLASATQAASSSKRLLELATNDARRTEGLGRAAASALAVHRALQRPPIATAASLVAATGLTPATVNKSLAHLERIAVVAELKTIATYVSYADVARASRVRHALGASALCGRSIEISLTPTRATTTI
jgi:Fic family protein